MRNYKCISLGPYAAYVFHLSVNHINVFHNLHRQKYQLELKLQCETYMYACDVIAQNNSDQWNLLSSQNAQSLQNNS